VKIARFLQSCDINMIATPAVAGFAHEAVLAAEVLDALAPRDRSIYVDGTVGGAGHAAQLLARAPEASLIGIDRDRSALVASAEILAPFAERARLVHGEYGDLAEILAAQKITQVDGILLDLGVSSPQLDVAERGFSFTKPGPLDMRMDPTAGPTALDILRSTFVDDLVDLLFTFGEERHAKKIARLIKEALAADRLHTTTDLASLVARAVPAIEQRKCATQIGSMLTSPFAFCNRCSV
jgi:16S rRNA (cytosine1402-N4)-methyltransferase